MTTSPSRTDFIINRRSGTVLRVGEEEIRKTILENFDGAKLGEIKFVEGTEVASAVRDWAAAHEGGARGLIIGGGDGTVITAAEQILGRKDIVLGILPFGTQNLIARQLGFSADFKKAVEQSNSAEAVEMDVGKVNGNHFLVGLVLDKNSVALFKAREALRDKQYFSGLKKVFSAAVGVLFGFKGDLAVSARADWQGNKMYRGRVFAVMNNKLKPHCLKEIPQEGGKLKNAVAGMLAKDEASSGALAFYTFDGGLPKTMSVLPKLMEGTWTEDQSVQLETSPQFYIQRARWKNSPEDVPLILDGEIKTVKYPLEINILPKALKVYRPK